MKTHKENVVQGAITGMKLGGGFVGENAECFRPLLETIFDSGYTEAIRQMKNKLGPAYTDVTSDGGMGPR